MPERRDPSTIGGMLRNFTQILLIPGWIVAIALMLKGYADVGDGFAAGVIAALAVILYGLAFGAEELERMAAARLAPVLAFIGLGIAYSVAFIPVLFGKPVMYHIPTAGQSVLHFGALEFITPVLFDLGVFLVVYGFCVGVMMAVARAEVRHHRILKRVRRGAMREGDQP